MTRYQYTKKIENEIKKINERIDYKILRGEQYLEDSKRHKVLLSKIRQQRKAGIFVNLIPSFF